MLTSSSVSYHQDLNLWWEHTIELLRSRRFEQLDLDNLIDELESMSKRDRREIFSRFKLLLMHLLKWKYQPSQRSGSWESTIRNQREEIALILTDSPSLKSYPGYVLEQAYVSARKNAASERGLSIETFPETCPFSVEAAFDEEFWTD